MPRLFKQKKGEFMFPLDKRTKSSSSLNTYVPPELPEPNKVTSLETNRSDEELVYLSCYDFGMDIELLLEESRTSRRADRIRRNGKGKPPRPQNPFMLYRRSMAMKYKEQFDGLRSSIVSSVVGRFWKEEEKEVKQLFEAAARVAEKRFMEKYPDYKYEPKTHKEKRNETDTSQQKVDTNETYPNLVTTASNVQLNPVTNISNADLTSLVLHYINLENNNSQYTALDPTSFYPSPVTTSFYPSPTNYPTPEFYPPSPINFSTSGFYPSPSYTASNPPSFNTSPIDSHFDNELIFNDQQETTNLMFASLESIVQDQIAQEPIVPNESQEYNSCIVTDTSDPVLYCNDEDFQNDEDFLNFISNLNL